MSKKIISARKAPTSRSMGPHVRQVIPSGVENLDPFVFLDHFGPMIKHPNSEGIPPHPHAGIATITYLFAGSNRHQDSYGHDIVVQASDIALMQAGKGIVHSEGMHENRTEPETVHGLQIWISLPAQDKFIEPDFFFYPSNTLPTFQHENSSIKVLCGELLGHTSPVVTRSPAYIFEIKMPANTTLELPIPTGNTCGAYLINGAIEMDNQVLHDLTIAKLEAEHDTLVLHAQTESHIVLLGGKPLNESVVAYASFVMNSEAQIRQVIQDYQNGKMGYL
jgi:hypothetical protein